MTWPGVRSTCDIAPGFYPIKYSIGDEELEGSFSKYPYICETMALLGRGCSESNIYYRFKIGKKDLRKYKQILRVYNGKLNHVLSKFPHGVWKNDCMVIKTESGYVPGNLLGVFPDHVLFLSKNRGSEYLEISVDEILDVDFNSYDARCSRSDKYIHLGYIHKPR